MAKIVNLIALRCIQQQENLNPTPGDELTIDVTTDINGQIWSMQLEAVGTPPPPASEFPPRVLNIPPLRFNQSFKIKVSERDESGQVGESQEKTFSLGAGPANLRFELERAGGVTDVFGKLHREPQEEKGATGIYEISCLVADVGDLPAPGELPPFRWPPFPRFEWPPLPPLPPWPPFPPLPPFPQLPNLPGLSGSPLHAVIDLPVEVLGLVEGMTNLTSALGNINGVLNSVTTSLAPLQQLNLVAPAITQSVQQLTDTMQALAAPLGKIDKVADALHEVTARLELIDGNLQGALDKMSTQLGSAIGKVDTSVQGLNTRLDALAGNVQVALGAIGTGLQGTLGSGGHLVVAVQGLAEKFTVLRDAIATLSGNVNGGLAPLVPTLQNLQTSISTGVTGLLAGLTALQQAPTSALTSLVSAVNDLEEQVVDASRSLDTKLGALSGDLGRLDTTTLTQLTAVRTALEGLGQNLETIAGALDKLP